MQRVNKREKVTEKKHDQDNTNDKHEAGHEKPSQDVTVCSEKRIRNVDKVVKYE